MTTLKNGDRRIDFTFGSVTTEIKKVTTEEKTYVITLPKVICNNEHDAKIIDSQVNKFVSDLVKEVLSKED